MNKHNKKKKSGQFIGHTSCDKCGSSDAMAMYKQEDSTVDGTCFSCGHYQNDNVDKGSPVVTDFNFKNKETVQSVADYPIDAIRDRGITKKVADRYGVRVSYDEETREINKHFYPMYKQGVLTGYQERRLPKDFHAIGDTKGCSLFGANVAGGKGKMLIITEGALDAMAAAQMFYQKGKNYRVVSLPSGANVRAIKDNYEWVDSFEQVILCLDQDDAGVEATEKIADMLPVGKVKVMKYSEKDPCDMLMKNKGNEFFSSLVNSVEHKPDGIVTVEDIYEEAIKPVERGLPWPWQTLTNVTYGRRRKELYGFGAGSGCGKTEGFKEIIEHVVEKDKLPVGLFFLEENPATTLKVIAGKMVNKRFHIPDGEWTLDELKSGINNLKGKVYLYNHFGQKSYEVLKAKIRYMVVALGIKDIFLDHLTALVADEKDVNAALGRIMADMAGLTQELDFTLYFISHLATPNGTPHEEGGRVTASQFRGSRTIMFWSNFLFGYERNQQEEDPKKRNTTTFRVLKDRYTGLGTGTVFNLYYDHETGRMLEQKKEELEF